MLQTVIFFRRNRDTIDIKNCRKILYDSVVNVNIVVNIACHSSHSFTHSPCSTVYTFTDTSIDIIHADFRSMYDAIDLCIVSPGVISKGA